MTHIIDEGYRAFNCLKDPQAECPYAHMNRKRSAWLDGWTQAATEKVAEMSALLRHFNLLISPEV